MDRDKRLVSEEMWKAEKCRREYLQQKLKSEVFDAYFKGVILGILLMVAVALVAGVVGILRGM